MSIDITSIYESSYSIDSLVEQYMAVEEQPKLELEEKKEDLYGKKGVLTELHSKLSSLKTAAESLADPLRDCFAAKKAISSDIDKFTLSASKDAELGNHSLTVERLAVADTRISKQLNDTDQSFTGISTDQTFSIEIAHPTEADPENRVEIDVTIGADTFQQDNDQVLEDICDELNLAMSNAVLAGTITSTERIQASIVNEYSGVSRIIFRSMSSGYDYRMGMTDSAANVLSALEINQSALASGTGGGYMTEIGSSATDSQLNSKFLIDGLTLYRNDNTVSDALEGVTISLLDTFATSENMTISADTSTVKDDVREFLDIYNDLMQSVRDATGINSETGVSGVLSQDGNYMSMKNDLRNVILSTVEGVLNTDYSKLFNIGIEANSIGMLSIADASKFAEALEACTTNVSDIFDKETTGIVDQLVAFVDKYVGAEGKIFNSKDTIDSQVSYLDDRIETLEDSLEQRESQLREEFLRLQEAMALLSSQQNYLQSFT
jgi:flagellar hook-associated protein 2